MVAYGYILPKKNIDTRLETLRKGLKNQNIKNINAKANLNLYSPLTNKLDNLNKTKPILFSPLPPKGDEYRQPTTTTSPKEDEIRPPEILQEIYQLGLLAGVKEDEIRPPESVAGTDATVGNLIAWTEDIIQKMTKKRYQDFDALVRKNTEGVRTAQEIKQRLSQVKVKKRLMEEIKQNKELLNRAKNTLDEMYTYFNYPIYDRININTTSLTKLNNEIARLINFDEPMTPTNTPPASQFDDELEDIPPLIDEKLEDDISVVSPTERQSSMPTLSSWTSSNTSEFQNFSNDRKEAILFVEAIENLKTEDEFINFLKQNKAKKMKINLFSNKTKNPYYRLEYYNPNTGKIKSVSLSPSISDKTLKYIYETFKTDKRGFMNFLKNNVWQQFGSEGTGLTGGKVKKSPYYSSYSPNFGNLHLMENSLKKNQLTIYRPYSKITVASKSGISPLLKKMILDIQNTLEFNQTDYNNLEGDEKRVIERIIRSQKEMKNYNIQSLIDQDDFTAKKRLDILVGQINAGNNSKLIREEMKALLKKLFDNKAISPTKYRTSLNSIKALES